MTSDSPTANSKSAEPRVAARKAIRRHESEFRCLRVLAVPARPPVEFRFLTLPNTQIAQPQVPMRQEHGSCDCPSTPTFPPPPTVPTFQNQSEDLRHFHSTPESRSLQSTRPCNSRREVQTIKMPLDQLARSRAPERTAHTDQ